MIEDGKFRPFTKEEEDKLGIKSILDDPEFEKRFWEKAEQESGQERIPYGKDESYPLRERVFTSLDAATEFEAGLAQLGLPLVKFS